MSSTFLVPLDGSPFAELALPTAISLVREQQGRLELVVVHQPEPFDGYSDAPWNAAYRSREKQYVAEKADALSGSCAGEVGHALRSGEAAAAICAQARAVDADMIVMNTHGRTGVRRAWSGSVTNAVIARTALPVLVLRESPSSDGRRAPARVFLRVVVAVDQSPTSLEIFDAVRAVVTRGASEVHLVRVVTPVTEVVDVSLPFGFANEAGNDAETKSIVARVEGELAAQAARLEEMTGCDVIPHALVSRRPSLQILDFAYGVGAQLIALSTGGGGGAFRRDVAAKVLRGSIVPVLVARPAADVGNSPTQKQGTPYTGPGGSRTVDPPAHR